MPVPAPLVLSKVVCIGTAFLLGAFFVHWLPDHPLLWQGPRVPDSAVPVALRYYAHLYAAPPAYPATLAALAALTVLATLAKLVLAPLDGLLFEGATLMLLLSALTVYVSNVLAALRYLPLDLPPATFAPGSDPLAYLRHAAPGISSIRIVEALQSVAASHMIIAVSLTGVLALQGAQAWAERPSRGPVAAPVPAAAPAPPLDAPAASTAKSTSQRR